MSGILIGILLLWASRQDYYRWRTWAWPLLLGTLVLLLIPLLPFTREELAAHVREHELATHDDPANRDPRHLRSWLRHAILPQLEERLGARVRGDLARLGKAAARDRRAWDSVLDRLPDLDLHAAAESCDVARSGLRAYDDALAVAVLRAAARRVGLVLGPQRARRLLELAHRPSGRRLELGAGWHAEVAFDRLRIYRPAAAARAVAPRATRGVAHFGDYAVKWGPATAPQRMARAAHVHRTAGMIRIFGARAERNQHRLDGSQFFRVTRLRQRHVQVGHHLDSADDVFRLPPHLVGERLRPHPCDREVRDRIRIILLQAQRIGEPRHRGLRQLERLCR